MTDNSGDKMIKHNMEILAPAGDAEMLRAAVYSGADCVYLGVKGFNARRGAANFDAEELAQAVSFCHARSCKVYAAVNTLALPGQEKLFEETLQGVYRAGCDAAIIQDLAALAGVQALQNIGAVLPLHASTQMSVHSLAGVQKLAELGFSRAILARELSEEEIAEIAAKSPIELEVFVHGALCVSVSGQCYMSAFLGGRSANRGACAGPCRLPFANFAGGAPASTFAKEGQHALSLKDLSILDALPRLEQIGVASAKIEGRLRGAEYCAVVTDSARKALNGEEYNKELLQTVFSRSGFTDGWFKGDISNDMFGMRTDADASAAKKALPQARELYRREMPRVPVDITLKYSTSGGEITVSDGTETLRRRFAGPLAKAEKDNTESVAAALTKTGGTPFYLQSAPVIENGGAFLPPAEAGRMRKELLEVLLLKRSAPPRLARLSPYAESSGLIGRAKDEAYIQKIQDARKNNGRPLLRARFESLAQMPKNAPQLCERVILPLWEFENVPEALRKKTILYLPRVMFGGLEHEAQARIERAKAMGFAGFEANNIAHFKLCEGLPVSGGFGLNIANINSFMAVAAFGCETITLSAELSLAQITQLTKATAEKADGIIMTDALCYGHLPLIITRACPVMDKNKGCAGCKKSGKLTDRKGEYFTVLCKHGTRQIFNPVPLWLADKLPDLPTDFATLYFTSETKEETAQILEDFDKGAPAPAAFTRGLYNKGTQG